jgi:hypothetical protein
MIESILMGMLSGLIVLGVFFVLWFILYTIVHFAIKITVTPPPPREMIEYSPSESRSWSDARYHVSQSWSEGIERSDRLRIRRIFRRRTTHTGPR